MSYSFLRHLSILVVLAEFWIVIVSSDALASSRTKHRVGAYVGGYGGSYYTANIGVNTSELLRIHAGVGTYTHARKLGGADLGGDYFLNSQSVSIFVGGDLQNLTASVKSPGTSFGVAAEGGADWTASFGLNLGIRAVLPLSNLTGLSLNWYAGWYF